MLLLFGSLIFLILVSVPVGFSIGISAIIGGITSGAFDFDFVARSMVTAYDSFPVLAVPLFILAGEVMSRGTIAERLFDLVRLFVGRFTGGIPMAVVGACLLFGAMSGSSAADTAALGIIMIPALHKMGYPLVFVCSIIAAAGGLAVIMPPSITMIMYGVTANVSIGQMFISGIIPSIVFAVMLMFYCNIYCRIKGLTADRLQLPEEKPPLIVLKRSVLAALGPVIILGGIYGGIFTPTEAASVAVVYSLVVGWLIYRVLNFKDVIEIFRSTSELMGPILIILGAAIVFGRALSFMQVPEAIANGILGISENPAIVLLVINLLLLLVGVFMETLSSILILTPILLPIALDIGMHPVHFGLMMIVNLEIGFITPPMAINLIIVSSIAKIPMEKVAKGIVIPFLLYLLGLLVIIYVPWYSLMLLPK
jgi:C4-dicarboxylate transporter DctM subunit